MSRTRLGYNPARLGEPVRNWMLVALAVFATAMAGFGLPGNARRAKQGPRSAWTPPPGQITLNLWPHGAPDATPSSGPERNLTTPKDPLTGGKSVIRLANVSAPTITLYEPKRKNTGAAVVVFPGGGYQILAMDLEGTEVCRWLNSVGITCVLLKYRVPNSGPYPKSPQALEDAQRAVGMVRARATAWHIDPHRIGVLGFSAGGYLVAALSTHYDQRLYRAVDADDQQSCRPDFAVAIYPAYLTDPDGSLTLTPNIPVTSSTPPTFLLQTEDDPYHAGSSIAYFVALKKANVPAELHLYAKGGHGYGLRRTAFPVTRWPELVETWLRTIHVLGSRS
jgi:acetyl esterase/lipase